MGEVEGEKVNPHPRLSQLLREMKYFIYVIMNRAETSFFLSSCPVLISVVNL